MLIRIVDECAEICFNDLCLPQESRDFFSKKSLGVYSVFYGLLLDNLLPSKFEDETVTNILMTETTNHILIHLSGDSDIVSLQPPLK